jgi:hypothetical protein
VDEPAPVITPSSTTLDQFKNLVWISTGGLVVGTSIRHGYDAIHRVPDIADSPLIDLGALLLGASFILLWLLVILASAAIVQRRPWKEAVEHWDRSFPAGRKGIARNIWLFMRFQSTVTSYIAGYFVVAFIWCYAITAGDLTHAFEFFGYWSLFAIAIPLFMAGVEKKWFSQEPDMLGKNVVTLLNLPDIHGRFVFASMVISFWFGMIQYTNISQALGGGRPEKAVVFLKGRELSGSPSQSNLTGKVMYLIFRRGSKFGFKAEDMKDVPILVLDQEQIDHLYVGTGIDRADLSKLN